MAKTRDIVVGAIIIGSFVIVLLFFGIFMIGMMSGGDGVSFSGFGQTVGVIEMYGVLTEDSGRPIVDRLNDWAEDGGIKAIVIHVNSPGGEVAISQEIYDAVLRVRDRNKPVVVSMAAVAASGGYYIACGADRIIANPGTLTGSIGVIFSFHTFEGLFDKIGVGTEIVQSGDLKAVGTYSRPMSEQEELMLRAVVMDTYEQFVAAVADGRGMEKEDVYPLADGSLFTGSQAYSHGLVDTLGGLDDAIDLAADLADIQGEPDVYRPRRKKVGLFGEVVEGLLGGLSGAVESRMQGPRLLYLYQ